MCADKFWLVWQLIWTIKAQAGKFTKKGKHIKS